MYSECTYVYKQNEMSTGYISESVIRGHHVSKAHFMLVIGRVLPCANERGNLHDIYAVNHRRFGGVPHTFNMCSKLLQSVNIMLHKEESIVWASTKQQRHHG